MRRLFDVTMLFLVSLTASATVRYRVLVPIYYEQPVPGALGSQWMTQLPMHNGGAEVPIRLEIEPLTAGRGAPTGRS